jgi:prevent-host-death family protein
MLDRLARPCFQPRDHVDVEEAQTHLSRLLRQVDEGDEVVIERDGRPVARLVPLEPQGRRFGGQLAGRLHVPDDFDDPSRTTCSTCSREALSGQAPRDRRLPRMTVARG